MKKKSVFLVSAIVFLSLSLFACGEKADSKDTTAADDWRDSIEYEGSFYVSPDAKMLYALEPGKVTLWHNNGTGSIFDTLEYETTADDALERFETQDFNGDGYTDIRIVYDENEERIQYNLWLWDDFANRFSLCGNYRKIDNPQFNEETGNVTGTFTLEGFGKIEKQYAFNNTGGINEISSTILNMDEIASAIAPALGITSYEKAELKISVNSEDCTLYKSTAGYLAAAGTGNWYADPDMMGLYRKVDYNRESSTYSVGSYVGDAQTIGKICTDICGEGARILPDEKGRVWETPAKRYAMYEGDSLLGYIIVATENLTNTNGIYYSLDGEGCDKILYEDGKYKKGPISMEFFEIVSEEETTYSGNDSETTAETEEYIDEIA